MTPKRRLLGKFETSGEVVLGDPCYLQGEDEDHHPINTVFAADNIGGERFEMAPGEYFVLLDELPSEPVCLIIAKHATQPPGFFWEEEFEIYNDAGMMGVFDISKAQAAFDYDQFIRDETPGTVYSFGPVVRSGGDGVFPVFFHRDGNGAVDGVLVQFQDLDSRYRARIERAAYPAS